MYISFVSYVLAFIMYNDFFMQRLMSVLNFVAKMDVALPKI